MNKMNTSSTSYNLSSSSTSKYNSTTKTRRITDLPDQLLQQIFLSILDSRPNPNRLNYRATDNFDHAATLASLDPLLKKAFQQVILSVHIDWRSPLTPRELASFRCLTDLRIQSHPRAGQLLFTYFRSFRQLSSLSLHNICLGSFTLQVLLTPNLKVLRLHFVTILAYDHVLSISATKLSNLKQFSLRAMPCIQHDDIVKVCQSACKNLQNLSLRYLRHPDISDQTLIAIAQSCHQITHLCLDDIRYTSAYGIRALCKSAAGRLLSLQLHHSKLQSSELPDLVTCFPKLSKLVVEEPTWESQAAQHIYKSYITVASTLEVLDIRSILHIKNILGSVKDLNNNGQRLRSLSLRGMDSFFPSAFTQFSFSRNLRELDFRGCLQFRNISWFVQEVCSKYGASFHRLALGSDNKPIPRSNQEITFLGAGFNFSDVLRWCGSLEEFIWNHPFQLIDHKRARMRRRYIRSPKFKGTVLAECLLKYCPKLLRVEINGTRLAVSGSARASCDLAFIYLEEHLPHCDVILDNREPE